MFEASVRVVCACELVRVHAPVGRRWAIKGDGREGVFIGEFGAVVKIVRRIF
jgi:hypothetical protein